jgi:isochorismatase family protein
MLIDVQRSMLLAIDLQQKMLPAIADGEQIEAHVCLLQTALDLYHEGKEVYVVADCVGSRRHGDRDLALARMRQEGVRIVSREMVAFEWLGEAGTPLFSAVNKELLKA